MSYMGVKGPVPVSSKKTFNMMDSAMENLDNGIVSEKIELSEFEDTSDV